MRVFSFTQLRIGLLFGLLLAVMGISHYQREQTRAWQHPLQIILFPINGDQHPDTQRYVEQLQSDDFKAIESWFSEQAQAYALTLKNPVEIRLGDSIEQQPPMHKTPANALETVLWGLQMRWWAFRNTPDDVSNLTRVRIFVVYHQIRESLALPHSVGLEKGLLGVVHAFAADKQTGQNNIVIAHELLHTVGASDKYAANGRPINPLGLAEPTRTPLFPQTRAEIMAGHIARSATHSSMARSLQSVVINPYTAAEINWTDRPSGIASDLPN